MMPSDTFGNMPGKAVQPRVLKGRTILVTRPKLQQAPLCEALAALGAKTISLPCLAIDALEDNTQLQVLKQQVMELDRYQKVIFISTNAVNHAMSWVEDYWPQLPAYQRYYAIGKATAEEMHQYGIDDSGAAATGQLMNSEALLEHPDFQQLEHQHCLIFRGVGGREHLADELRKRGALVDYCDVYQRRSPHYQPMIVAEALRACDTVIANSGETLENLCQLAAADQALALLLTKPVLVPGARVAALANALGFHSVQESTNASVAAICERLRQTAR
jgi:uroporphyrinogen-III synthase